MLETSTIAAVKKVTCKSTRRRRRRFIPLTSLLCFLSLYYRAK